MHNSGVTPLKGELTIYHAAQLKAELQALLRSRKPGEIHVLDLSGVTEVDCSGIQLVLAAKRAMKTAGSHLELITPEGSTISMVFVDLGIDQDVQFQA